MALDPTSGQPEAPLNLNALAAPLGGIVNLLNGVGSLISDPLGLYRNDGSSKTSVNFFDPLSVILHDPLSLNDRVHGPIANAVRSTLGPKMDNPAPQMSSPKLSNGGTWTANDPTWSGLSNYEKAAAMAVMEAGQGHVDEAKNVGASMVNRAVKNNLDLGDMVSSRTYQPSFEPAQQARLQSVLKSKDYSQLTDFVSSYDQGQVPDPTGGATHFLAHPSVMLNLEAQNPSKYRSWRSWTGFDASTGTYAHTTFQDGLHTFLAPEGSYSVPLSKDQSRINASE